MIKTSKLLLYHITYRDKYSAHIHNNMRNLVTNGFGANQK
jgi:hypothetical protein